MRLLAYRKQVFAISTLIIGALFLSACGESSITATATIVSGNPTVNPTATTSPTLNPTVSATPTVAPTQNQAQSEQEVSFTVGQTTNYATLLLPAKRTGKVPAALLIAGSGPTDRNGNSRILPGEINSQKNFAEILAEAGIASLRYDKLGSGKTGLGSYAANLTAIGFDVFMEEARAAYNYLKTQPDIDTSKLLIVGHSEGGLIGLVLADELKTSQTPPKALVLAAPLSKPYLQTIKEQLTTQYTAAKTAKQMPAEQADAAITEIEAINQSLLQTGKLPAQITEKTLTQIYNPAVEKFLAQVGKYDPPKIASSLPRTLPVLLLCGEKDSQVSCADVQNLRTSLEQAGNSKMQFVAVAKANHVFREVEGAAKGATDYTNPAYPFSAQLREQLTSFVKTSL